MSFGAVNIVIGNKISVLVFTQSYAIGFWEKIHKLFAFYNRSEKINVYTACVHKGEIFVLGKRTVLGNQSTVKEHLGRSDAKTCYSVGNGIGYYCCIYIF